MYHAPRRIGTFDQRRGAAFRWYRQRLQSESSAQAIVEVIAALAGGVGFAVAQIAKVGKLGGHGVSAS
jgi:hypothetical protein